MDYLVGQYSPLARKSLEPMALAVEGSRIRSLPRFRSETVWAEEQRRWNAHPLVADELGEPDGVLLFEASGVVNKGKDSAGVARPYWGTLGKVEHGQGGVLAGYASRPGQALVAQRLVLPDVWFGPAYAPRRRQGQGPDAPLWQTKAPWAAAMLRSLRPAGIRPCRYIGADSVQGHSPDFLAAIAAGGGTTALGAISAETRWGPQRPAPQEQPQRYKGAERAKRPLRPTASAPQSVAALAATLPGRGSGSGAQSRKGPKGQWRMTLRVTA